MLLLCQLRCLTRGVMSVLCFLVTGVSCKHIDHRNLFTQRMCCKRQSHFVYIGQGKEQKRCVRWRSSVPLRYFFKSTSRLIMSFLPLYLFLDNSRYLWQSCKCGCGDVQVSLWVSTQVWNRTAGILQTFIHAGVSQEQKSRWRCQTRPQGGDVTLRFLLFHRHWLRL